MRLAAVFGLLAVGLGAFGAHALRARLEAAGSADTWQTAVFYHLGHALALLAIARPADAGSPGAEKWLGRAALAWAAGIVLFSGSLYWMALGAPRPIAFVTPLGGVAFLAGWACLLGAGAARPDR